MAISVDDLRSDRKTRRLLLRFDFEVLDLDGDNSWFAVDGVERCAIVARDGGGGCYVELDKDGPIAFVSSARRTGIIARDLEQCLQLVITHPYWLNVIRDDIDLMRRAARDEEATAVDDNDALDDQREELRERLELDASGRELDELHRALTMPGKRFRVSPATDRGRALPSLLD